LTLREEHRLKIFGNRMLRRIFGTKRNEMVGRLRKMHNEEFNSMYTSSNIIRTINSRSVRWTVHVAHTWEGKGVLTGFW
jgi:hypothetical protein